MDRFVIRKRPAPPGEEHETSSDSGRSETHPVKQTWRKFRNDWLSRFSWLRNKDGCSYCIACDKKLSNHLSFIKKHNVFPIHKQNEQKKNIKSKWTSFWMKNINKCLSKYIMRSYSY
ncbi:uncharacterized protein LOC126765385 [Bactrocera neohumeralis]|uniref:uncharacterized protein LOC126765385 n=1 Tax=Bactrocera neohumeralis TaxID=98809 RepID=UPI0021668B91|nr:uncharacterized protein LOC126765385 [Bactrocera neohumeralis]